MIDIRLLEQLDIEDLKHLTVGYSSNAHYRVSKTDSGERFALTLELVTLPRPYIKRYDHLGKGTLEHYRSVPAFGFSYGAFDKEQCVGIEEGIQLINTAGIDAHFAVNTPAYALMMSEYLKRYLKRGGTRVM